MLSRQQLEIINRKTLRYPLHIAEKDYLLALVLQLITDSPLGEKLVFKGGTAIHHCYLEQHRFSEDLDFSSGQYSVSFEEVQEVLTSLDYLEIKKHYQSNATIKIERLLYTGPLGHPNSIKVEIDLLQNVLLPVKRLPYRTTWGFEFPVRVMDIREISAEKIRAMSDRARYRDFYDMFLILEIHQPDLEEIIGCIRRKEIRQSISKTSIMKNWVITRPEKESERQTTYYSRPVDDHLIEKMIQNLPFDEIK
jgi:predicted nucleotidyltransferase component of viral defense system